MDDHDNQNDVCIHCLKRKEVEMVVYESQLLLDFYLACDRLARAEHMMNTHKTWTVEMQREYAAAEREAIELKEAAAGFNEFPTCAWW